MEPSEPSPRTRRRTGSYRAADDKRDAILDAAGRLFAEHGFHETPLTKVALAAGTSQTGLLHHFRSKDALLLEVLRRHDVTSAHQFSDVAGGIRPLLDDMLGVLRSEVAVPGFARLLLSTAMAAVAPDHFAHEYFLRRSQLITDYNARAVAASIDAGELRRDLDPTQVGRHLLAVSDGLKAQWLLAPTFDLTAAVQTHFADLLRGLAVPSDQRQEGGGPA